MVRSYRKHKLLYTSVIAAMLMVGSGVALLRAQEADLAPRPQPTTNNTPFTLYSSDDGAVQFGDRVTGPVPQPTDEEIVEGSMTHERHLATTAETHAAADDTEAWADTGPAVGQAWSGYTAAMQAQAAAAKAAYEAGLSDSGDVGVLP